MVVFYYIYRLYNHFNLLSGSKNVKEYTCTCILFAGKICKLFKLLIFYTRKNISVLNSCDPDQCRFCVEPNLGLYFFQRYVKVAVGFFIII